MYAAAGGLSLARRQARRQQRQLAAEVQRPSYKPPSTPVPPLRHHQSHQLQVQNHDELLQMSRDAQAQLLEPPTYSELNGCITSFGSTDLSPEGKAAWQEKDRERRVSVTEAAANHRLKATEAHRRWMKRNQIHDSSFGGSISDDDDYTGGLHGQQNAAANALLYVGLGTIAIGLVISFVGTGEKGFKTLELRLIGPTLIGSGLMCCLVRVFLCVCPSRCLRRDNKQRKCHKNSLKSQITEEQQQTSAVHLNHHSFFGNAKCGPKESKRSDDIVMADQTKLLQKNINSNYKKSVSILTTPVTASTTTNMPVPVPSGSSGYSSHRHHHQQQQQHNLQYQQQIPKNAVASTSLFLQHEQQCSSFINFGQTLQVPAISIPNSFVSNSDEEDILASAHLFEESKGKDSDLLDFELQQLDSSSFDISNFECNNDRDGILRTGRAESVNSCGKSLESDKRRTSLTSSRRNSGATLTTSKATIATTGMYSPSTRIGLVNPDPDAHKLEEEILLLEEEIQMSSTTSKDLHDSPFASAVSSSSPGKHSDIERLLQNEIVLSPSKLQQTVRKQ